MAVSRLNVSPKLPAPLFRPYVMQGIITIFSGPKSSNKSTLATYLSAKLSVGINGFSNQQLPRNPSLTTLYASLEDANAVTLHRYIGMGGKRKRLFFSEVRDSENIDLLVQEISEVRPGLLVIDSLTSFFGTALAGKSIQHNLRTIERLSEQHQMATIIIHHPSRNPQVADEWVGGANRIQTFIRSGFYVCRDPHKPDERIFTQAKWQYGRDLPSFRFRIAEQDGDLNIVAGESTSETIHDVMSHGTVCDTCSERKRTVAIAEADAFRASSFL